MRITRRLFRWLEHCRFVRRVRLDGGESRDIWRVGRWCVKRWLRSITPADVRARCRASRAHADFASTWYVPWLHWTVRPWIPGHYAPHEFCERLQRRHRWAIDVHNNSNVIQTAAGDVRIIDFGLAPPLE